MRETTVRVSRRVSTCTVPTDSFLSDVKRPRETERDRERPIETVKERERGKGERTHLLCCGERCFAPPPRGRAVRDVDDRSAAAATIFGLKHTPPKKGVLITKTPALLHQCRIASPCERGGARL